MNGSADRKSLLPAEPSAASSRDSTPATHVRRGRAPDSHWAAGGQWFLRILSPLLLIALWEALSRAGILDRRFFPPPSEIVVTALDMLRQGEIASASLETLRRMVIGYAIGAVSGVLVGLWLGLSRWSRALLEPWILITYPIPKLAIYPLIILVVGLGDLPIVILLAIAVFYIVAINSIAGVLAIKPVVLDVARDCNASFAQIFWTVALPACLPHIFTGLEIALGIAYVLLIAAEFVGAKSGLGNIIWSSWQVFDVAPMYVAIVTVSLLGYFSVIGFRAMGNLIMPWRHKHR